MQLRWALVSACLVASPLSGQAPQNISLCIVDPAALGGVSMHTARVLENGDTLVNVAGSDKPIHTQHANFPAASGSDWYVNGRPLTIGNGGRGIERFLYGPAQVITNADRLAFLGFVRGTPLFADRKDVTKYIDQLTAIYRRTPNRELGDILAKNRILWSQVDNTPLLYVPVFVVGCVFQGVITPEAIRNE
jgi:hypothetical protein